MARALPLRLIALSAGLLLLAAAGGLATLRSPSARSPVAAPSRPAAEVAPVAPARSFALRIHGSNTIGSRLAPALVAGLLERQGASDVAVRADEQEKERTLITATVAGQAVAVEVLAPGSARAFKDLKAGLADLGASSRPITAEEAASLAHLGDLTSPAAETVVGLDGVAVIVHRTNPLPALNRKEVAQLFSGAVADWGLVSPGPGDGRRQQPGAIHVLSRNRESGTYDTFKNLVLKPQKLDDVAASAQRFEDSEQLEAAVAADPGAIGFIGFPFVKATRAVPIREVEGGRAVAPTPFSIATEEYPLSRRLYFYLPPGSTNRLARDLVEFAVSDAGQAVVADAHFISLVPKVLSGPPDWSCAEARSRLGDSAEHVSISFRFRAGSSDLDSRAEWDLSRLARLLPRHQGREVYLFGYTDNQGRPQRNLELAGERARAVAARLSSLIPSVKVHAGSCGGVSPVSSNDTEEGRQRNRRVEVFLR